MSKCANLIVPFVCKWLGSHSIPQRFETQEKLKNHIGEHDINSCNRSCLGDQIYICPWEGCNKHQSSVIKLEEHLRGHTRQRPFKCPICNRSRFSSPDALSKHLIINHNGSVVETDDDTSCDENEELNLEKAKDKNDVRVKKEASKDEKNEIIPMSNTTKLSYHDVLVKGRVNENKNAEDFMVKSHKHEETAWDLICKGLEIISLLPEEPVNEYDFDNENYDDLPDAPKGKLSEYEQDKLIWETFREIYKDTEANEYFDKASEMMKRGTMH